VRSVPEGDPRAELAGLREALAAHLARRARAGARRVERTAAGWPRAPRGEEPGRADAPPPRPADAVPSRAGAPPERPPAPTAGAAPAWRAPWPSDWGRTPERKDEVERRAQAVAERARSAGDLESLRAAVAGCNACSLCATRTQTVFMDGSGPARVMFVGEAPGYHEDQAGVPFVGAAGQLLTDIVHKGMGLERSQVVIANVLKCRPPENRDPTPTEKRLCGAWLDRQIELVGPEVLIGLGRHAAGHLLGQDAPIGRLRGRVWERGPRKVVATYHPAYLLRSPQFKKECWLDIQLAMRELGLTRPGRG